MNRREFIKGLIAAGILAAVPSGVKYEDDVAVLTVNASNGLNVGDTITISGVKGKFIIKSIENNGSRLYIKPFMLQSKKI